MKKIYALAFLSLLFISSSKLLQAQDPNYSQFYFKESYYNPALVGANTGLRGVLTHRQIWTQANGMNTTSDMSLEYFDRYFFNGAFGMYAQSYLRGGDMLQTTLFGGRYSKRLMINSDWMIQLGIQGGYVMKQANLNNIHFSDEFDPRLGHVYETEFTAGKDEGKASYADFSAGAVLRFNIKPRPSVTAATTTFGIAMHHLTQPNEAVLNGGDSPLPAKLNTHLYSVIRLNSSNFRQKHMFACPGIIYENQSPMSEMFSAPGAQTMTFGANFIIPTKTAFISSLTAGVWGRKQFYHITESISYESLTSKSFDAIVLVLGYTKYQTRGTSKGKRLYRINYSYDLTVSNATLKTGGTHEIVFSFELNDLALPGGKRIWGPVKAPADRFFHMN